MVNDPIPLSSPDLDESDVESVLAVLRSNQLSLGPTGPAFEKAIRDYCGAPHAIAVNSGTSGLHLAVIGLGIGTGDEVVTSPFSFVASTNCFLFEGATPRFADIDPVTWDLDPAAAEAAINGRTKAILPIHVFGRPCRIREIVAIARRHGLSVLEDPCESLGSSVAGKMTGTFGDAGVFAFYPNKQITTGEGGAIVTGDDRLAELSRSLRNQGRGAGGGWLEHERLGYNYRLADLNAALGLSQMHRIERFIAMRQRIFDLYAGALQGFDEIIAPSPARPDERVSWFVYVVRLRDEFSRGDRDAVLEELRKRGVACRNYFVPIHLQPYMRERFGFREGMFPVTEAVSARSIALPFHNRLSEGEIDRTVAALRAAVRA